MEENELKYEHTLTPQQMIENIEEAPVEMQVMVAKAYLREDIKDEDVQYHFNTDTIEELNEDGAATVENINADAVEGIGAGEFAIRNSKPAAGNKNFIRTASGGWNPCVKGYPTDANCNVLANCVGYACGRFNEIINEARGTSKCTYTGLCCNAENFIERATAAGLKIGSSPRRGAIGCAMKGVTLSGNDGAGHVWIVEDIYSDGSTYTSESGYGSKAFWNQKRNNSNGRWGLGSSYSFRGYIYLPDDVQAVVDGSFNTPEPASTPSQPATTEWPKYHVVTSSDTVSGLCVQYYGKSTRALWDLIKNVNGLNDKYMIVNGKTLTIPDPNGAVAVEPTSEPVPAQPTVVALQVGDKVKIVGTGNGSSYGTGNTAYGIGWSRQILRIWEGREYPYQVGNNSGTTGFYKAEALQKK